MDMNRICTHISYRSYLATAKSLANPNYLLSRAIRFLLLSVDPFGGVSAGLCVFLPVSQ